MIESEISYEERAKQFAARADEAIKMSRPSRAAKEATKAGDFFKMAKLTERALEMYNLAGNQFFTAGHVYKAVTSFSVAGDCVFSNKTIDLFKDGEKSYESAIALLIDLEEYGLAAYKASCLAKHLESIGHYHEAAEVYERSAFLYELCASFMSDLQRKRALIVRSLISEDDLSDID